MTDPSDNELSNREVELEYKCRKIQQECRSITDYTVGGVGESDVVLTTDDTMVGVTSLSGPTLDFNNDGLIDYLLNEHGLRVRGFRTHLGDIDPGDSTDVEPSEVGVSLTEEQADMGKIRRRWLREQLETKIMLVLVHPDLE